MTLFGHKTYQQQALDALGKYLHEATTLSDANTAFYKLTGRAYHRVAGEDSVLFGIPYICLRLPTGGGKTVVAARAIDVARRELLFAEHPLVLWLVPTNAIREQTLRALRNPKHPYRRVLDAELDNRVTVLDLAEALSVAPSTLASTTTIIVSTLAAARVKETEERKVYEENGALMSHFSALPPALKSIVGEGGPLALEAHSDGTPIRSLANVLRLHRPLVIVDEAQNARTELSFSTLERFAPSCIIEMTATPRNDFKKGVPSNVLYHVAADELKAEGMVKLPVRLQTHGDWKEALRLAKEKREALEELAQGTPYIRPVALLQAEPKNGVVTWQVLLACLRDDLGVPPDQIAVETGEREDLKDVDVMSPSCPIRYVITVDKLREGWDCPFAYVLYSARHVKSKTAVEQILGRVLRMPYAERLADGRDELNLAYAFVTSAAWSEATGALADALVENGFTTFEAKENIQALTIPGLPAPQDGLFSPTASLLPRPAWREEPIQVPQLALRDAEGALEPLDESHLLDEWDLEAYEAALSEKELPAQVLRESVEVDVSRGGKLAVRRVEEFLPLVQSQLSLLTLDDIADAASLVAWLDRHIKHPDVPQAASQRWLMRLVTHLIEARGFKLETLARERLRVRAAAEAKIDAHRKTSQSGAFEGLFRMGRVEVDAGCTFSFRADTYPVNARAEGFRFEKHFYEPVGKMNGEELKCAQIIDGQKWVRRWVRNLESKPEASFHLQLGGANFYPDFVAELCDGRLLVIEYKGGDRIDNPDTLRKAKVGALWAERSAGRGLFLMVGAEDYIARISAVGAQT